MVSALTLCLVMVRLGETSLWSDEAITGLLGSNILKFGLPRVADGLLVIQSIPGDARDGLWIWDGWLQSYLSAAGEAIFGRTALGARFFHAIAGAFIPLAAYPLFRAMSSRRGVAEAATLLTGLSVPLIAYARQAHYYPEGMLLTVLLIHAYLASLRSRPWANFALIASATLLFHANFVWWGILGVALAIHLAVVRPPVRVATRLLGAAAVALIFVAPFAIWAQIWSRSFVPGVPPPSNPYVFFAFLRHYILALNVHAAPLVVLLLGGAAAAGVGRPLTAITCLLGAGASPIVLAEPHTAVSLWSFMAVGALFGLLGLGHLLRFVPLPRPPGNLRPGLLIALVCAGFVAIFAWLSIYPLFRYVTPLLPLIAFLLAQAIFALFRRGWLAWPAIALLTLTNAASVWPIQFAAGRKPLLTAVMGNRSPLELSRIVLPRWTRVPTLSSALFSEAWQPSAAPNLSPRSPLIDFVKETTRAFPRPFDVIADHINARKRPGDRFAIAYDPYPLAYHTGLAPLAFKPGTPPPRWVIPRARWRIASANLMNWIDRRSYREIVLEAPDTYNRNRPEPDPDRFRVAPPGARVRIWERLPAGGVTSKSGFPSGKGTSEASRHSLTQANRAWWKSGNSLQSRDRGSGAEHQKGFAEGLPDSRTGSISARPRAGTILHAEDRGGES